MRNAIDELPLQIDEHGNPYQEIGDLRLYNASDITPKQSNKTYVEPEADDDQRSTSERLADVKYAFGLDLWGPDRWYKKENGKTVEDFDPRDKAKFTEAQRFLSEDLWRYTDEQKRITLATRFAESVKALFDTGNDYGKERYKFLEDELKDIARKPNEELRDRWDCCQNLIHKCGELGRDQTPKKMNIATRMYLQQGKQIVSMAQYLVHRDLLLGQTEKERSRTAGRIAAMAS